ncbi:hypothetical protein ATY35_20930 [Vibrio cidicii]|uniref:Uncharacterized protein n=1 Tax=Vibrio cidicii TaxID=1763883 RepID=A0A151JFK1_9VIBR|nr:MULTISPECIES: hypothetical protein [Vibrio]ELV8627320.1 hypothetical protein [Vibrio cidicii]KYN24533.1 hypothetical protein AUQ44_00985 [Vibrio cidicii]KYN24551.1 hypothetical protein AUQ44_01105 [Vibrio cidicii]KYN24734.1 hypothetical protein AUQ44_02280 [Vibrio cidicii]KYN82971.1 hypothetical protein ATY37_20435 [Vibrio cidicii]
MKKYQFFCQPGQERKNFTFLRMDSDAFLREKGQLLDLGLEVDGDVIFASTDNEAIEKYQSNFTHLTEEMNDSHAESAIPNVVIEAFREISKLLSKRK